MSLTSKKGFFSIHFIFFLSLISMILFSYGFVFYAQKQKDLFRKICYYDLAETQKNLVRYEKQLFLLNPSSTALRLKLKILYAQLVAALASYNAPLAAKISVEIRQTKQAQARLDQIQRSLILQANAYLKTQLAKILHETQNTFNHENKIWKTLLKESKTYHLYPNSQFAVQPDSVGGVAPNYELKTNYEQLQSLNLELHYQMRSEDKTQTQLKTQQSENFYCQVSFNKKDQQWTLKINQDKPSLRL